jgi:hypothetical protein
MFGLLCLAVVLILAVFAFVSGLRARAFKVGRGRVAYAVALSSNPVGFWTTATILSITRGVCLAFILFALVHR